MKIVAEKVLNSGFAGRVSELTLADGRQLIEKAYAENSIENEWQMLNLLYDKGFSVARPVEYLPERNAIFYEKLGGRMLAETVFDEAEQEMPFAQLLFELHQLECASETDFVSCELAEVERLVNEHGLTEFLSVLSVLTELLAEADAVRSVQNVIIHRDYHPWNVLVRDDKKLFLLDVDCGWGDFRFDVAWTFCLLERSGYADFAQRFLVNYEKLAGQTLQDFAFFKRLATLRWLVNVSISLQREPSEFLEKMVEAAKKQLRNNHGN